MSQNEVINYMNVVKNYNDKEYLYSTIAHSAAPTLARVKPSSLLIFSKDNKNLKYAWKKYKKEIKDNLEIKFFELNKTEKNTVVLFYNSKMLEKIIKQRNNIKFLERFGYSKKMSLTQCLFILRERYEGVCPHEIGIFLGYPVKDVDIFVNCPNKKCLLVGYWKVYNDIEKAKNIFDKYDKVKYNIMNLIIKGINPTEILGSNYFAC